MILGPKGIICDPALDIYKVFQAVKQEMITQSNAGNQIAKTTGVLIGTWQTLPRMLPHCRYHHEIHDSSEDLMWMELEIMK